MYFLRERLSRLTNKDTLRVSLTSSAIAIIREFIGEKDTVLRSLTSSAFILLVRPLVRKYESDYGLTKTEALEILLDALNKLQGDILSLLHYEVLNTLGMSSIKPVKLGRAYVEAESMDLANQIKGNNFPCLPKITSSDFSEIEVEEKPSMVEEDYDFLAPVDGYDSDLDDLDL